jgi:hypothetical protein
MLNLIMSGATGAVIALIVLDRDHATTLIVGLATMAFGQVVCTWDFLHYRLSDGVKSATDELRSAFQTGIRQRFNNRNGEFWQWVAITAQITVGMSYLLRFYLLSSAGLAQSVIKGVQIVTVLVGLVALFRWAVLYEREKRKAAAATTDTEA